MSPQTAYQPRLGIPVFSESALKPPRFGTNRVSSGNLDLLLAPKRSFQSSCQSDSSLTLRFFLASVKHKSRTIYANCAIRRRLRAHMLISGESFSMEDCGLTTPFHSLHWRSCRSIVRTVRFPRKPIWNRETAPCLTVFFRSCSRRCS